MPKTDFDEFVKRQQATTSDAASIDWDKQRDEWLGYLDMLYTQIESFLETYLSAGQARCEYSQITLNEENIGSYTAKQMVLKIGRQQVIFAPTGTLLIGMKGRVDVLDPAGGARLFLVNKKATSARSLIKVTVSAGRTPPPQVGQPTVGVEDSVLPAGDEIYRLNAGGILSNDSGSRECLSALLLRSKPFRYSM
jgi:hypothetical protein